jgi:hypothetical protein
MIEDLKKKWPIIHKQSFMIGDQKHDQISATRSKIYFEYSSQNIFKQVRNIIKNISIEILNGSEEANQLKLDEFKFKGLYYIKNIHFTKKEYENLLFMLDYKTSYENRINKIDNMKIEDNNNLLFCFINKQPETHRFRAGLEASEPDNYTKTLELADLILNQNNLHRLKNQDIRNISTPFFSKSNFMFFSSRETIDKSFKYFVILFTPTI